jgi:hypothetical protein
MLAINSAHSIICNLNILIILGEENILTLLNYYEYILAWW